MADKRIILILIAMLTLAVSTLVFNIAHFTRMFAGNECEWARKAMDIISSIAPFAAMFSLIVINILVVFLRLFLPATDPMKLVVQTIKYVIYKAAFIPFVVPSTHYQARLWSGWLVVVFSLKLYLEVERDNLQNLLASPSATPWTISRFNAASRAYFTLLVHLAAVAYWVCVQMVFQIIEPSPVGLLLYLEPLNIAIQTLRAILVHGFQLIDIWLHHLPRNTTNSTLSEALDTAVGLIWERKQAMLRDVGFLLDITGLLMSLGHYFKIWQLHHSF